MAGSLSYPNKNVNVLTRREVHAQIMQPPNCQIPVPNATVGASLAQAHPATIFLHEDSFLSSLAQDTPEGRRLFIMDAKWPKCIVGYHKSKLMEGKESMKMRITAFTVRCLRADSCNISYGKQILSGKSPHKPEIDLIQNVDLHPSIILQKVVSKLLSKWLRCAIGSLAIQRMLTGGAPPASAEPPLFHPPGSLALSSLQPLEVNTLTRFRAPPAPASAAALSCGWWHAWHLWPCGDGLRWLLGAVKLHMESCRHHHETVQLQSGPAPQPSWISLQ